LQANTAPPNVALQTFFFSIWQARHPKLATQDIKVMRQTVKSPQEFALWSMYVVDEPE
jgi:hypothetical protein